MAELLPINFPVPSERAIATYSFTDIAEGTGVVKFYGFSTETSGALTYRLSTNPVYSSQVETSGSAPGTGTQVISDMDFDASPFNMPKTIKGNAIINFGYAAISAPGGTSGKAKVTVYIRKWNGTIETEIANATTPETAAAGSGSTVTKMACLPITIPHTHFEAGETLRITAVTQAVVTAASCGAVFAHDPQNRDGTYIAPSSDTDMTTKFEAYIPFTLDL